MQDQYGLVPPHIKANYDRAEMVDRQMDAAFSLYRALQAMDDRLDLVFISDRADPEYGVVPGRWHVTRKNDPPAPDSYMPIVTRDGGYREPDSGVLTELERRDMWKRGIPNQDGEYAAKKEYKHDDSHVEELAHDLRAGARLPGDGGLHKKLWGKGKLKGVVGT